MKIKHVVFGALLFAAAAGTASAQNFTAPITPRRTPATQRPAPPPITGTQQNGVVARGLRGGNPLQMLNPRAPAKYGTSAESISEDPQVRGRIVGIKFFELLF